MATSFDALVANLAAEHKRQVAALELQIEDLQRKQAERSSCSTLPTRNSWGTAVVAESSHQIDISKSYTTVDTRSSCETPVIAENVTAVNDKLASVPMPESREASLLTLEMPPIASEFRAHLKAGRSMTSLFTMFPGLALQKVIARERSARDMEMPLKTALKSSQFEALVMLVIALNTLAMALEIQYEGMGFGYSLNIAGYSEPAEDAWPDAANILEVSERVFVLIFTVELLLRLTAYRLEFFCHAFHWLDFVIVVAGLLDWIAGDRLSPSMIRLFRFARLARTLKSLNNHRFFDALHLLTSAIQVSISTLIWSLIMLAILQCIFALTIAQLLQGWLEDATASPDSAEVFAWYGTFTRSFVTLFEIILGNWGPPCRTLLNHVGEEFGFLVLVYKCTCGFAVLQVVSAVFIQQTMKILSQDTDIMLLERTRIETSFKDNLITLFGLLDVSQDGFVTPEEIIQRLQDSGIQHKCFAMGLSVHDLEDIINLHSLENKGMSVEDFIEAAQHTRKQANSLEVARLLMHSRQANTRIRSIQKQSEIILKTLDNLQGNLLGLMPKVRSSSGYGYKPSLDDASYRVASFGLTKAQNISGRDLDLCASPTSSIDFATKDCQILPETRWLASTLPQPRFLASTLPRLPCPDVGLEALPEEVSGERSSNRNEPDCPKSPACDFFEHAVDPELVML